MPDIGAGKTTLGIGDGGSPENFTTIGALRDPLPSFSIERAALDNTTTDSDVEKTRAGMKKIAPMAFKVEADSSNPVIAQIYAAAESGEEFNWKYSYPIKGGIEEVTFAAWVQKADAVPGIKDYTMLTITLNPNTESRA